MNLLRVVTLGWLSCTLFACGEASVVADDDSLLAQQTATPDAGDDAGAQPSGACDRTCLIDHVQKYLDALVAKDFKRLPVASTLKYTENGRVVQPGEGLFRTASSLVATARLDFADPVQGQVATQVVVNESGTTPVIYSARLKVVNHQITEIEAMAVRRQGAANGFFNPAKMVPEPAFLAPVDAQKRMTREALNAVTEQYLDYLEGKRKAQQVPFGATCKRYENGQVTASGLSAFNGQNFWRFQVTRRTLIIDEEAGITWGMYPFTQAATGLVVGEAFKVVEGKITMIQAVMANQPTKVWD
ncbi:MAG: hypothetical protein ABW252_04580 [Polyangiales bacterium]